MARDHPDSVFPPRPDHEHEWAALEDMIGGIVAGRQADYVSTPITTGPRFIQWYHSLGKRLGIGTDAYQQAHKQQVIVGNRLHAAQFVERLRAQQPIIIEPTSLDVGHWTQNDYRYLWGRVIERYVRRVWLLDGWQYSSGCAYEFFIASREGIETLTEGGQFITRKQGADMIDAAIAEIGVIGQSTEFLQAVAAALREIRIVKVEGLSKDESLDHLADSHNVAQFVSFGPGADPAQRHCRIMGVPSNHCFERVEEAIAELLTNSPDGSVNVRSFKPHDSRSFPFKYGCRTVEEAGDLVRKLATEGLHTIVNETIDIHDGGISGVLAGDLVEFAPDDTPRCVEREGTARLPVDIAETILPQVYGFRPRWDREPTRRVEFSIHPTTRGFRHDHTIIWEIGSLDRNWSRPSSAGKLQVGDWPNRFSRILGDKTYGLLVADALGFRVPRTSVFNTRIAPFHFGQGTGTDTAWLRTAPAVNEPGRYPTCRYAHRPLSIPSLDSDFPQCLLTHLNGCLPLLAWTAFIILRQHRFSPTINSLGHMENRAIAGETRTGVTPSVGIVERLPSVLAQEGVAAEWSGSLITEAEGARIEGVPGLGDRFMISAQQGEKLPDPVRSAVINVQQRLVELIGPVSMEWAYDGESVWVLQLHVELSPGSGDVFVPGEPEQWQEFAVSRGLAALHEFAETAAKQGYGIEFTESVGATSHAAAIARKFGVPARVRLCC